MKILIFSLMFISSTALAQSSDYNGHHYKLLNVEEFSVKYANFAHQRDPYLPQHDGKWANRASAEFTIASFDVLYWKNDIHTETIKSGPVKSVGWHWVLGLRVSKYIDIYHEHHSRHVMEEGPTRRYNDENSAVFPVEDSYGIRFKLIESTTDKQSLSGILFK